MQARYYIYRNLHRGLAFSVRHHGRVVDRLVDFVAHDVSFKVNELGRQRVLEERQKNIHAFVVADSYKPTTIEPINLSQVCYNPYKSHHFTVDGDPIARAQSVLFSGGKCYLLERHGTNL